MSLWPTLLERACYRGKDAAEETGTKFIDHDEPWQYRLSSCPGYAVGAADTLPSYNVWYRALGPDAPMRQALA